MKDIAAIVFDLDGTLVDSVGGIEASIHEAARRCFGVEASLPKIRDCVGPPIQTMLARLWPKLSKTESERLLVAFREHYDREGYRQSRLFAGVTKTLTKLEEDGIEMFVLTNKRSLPTLSILELTGIARHFRAVASPDSKETPFSVKSDGALELQRVYTLRAEATLVVGDGIDDAHAAEACGFGFVAAAYGYGNVTARPELKPRAVLETFSEIERVVL